jgi:putative addiction module killer protein
LFELKRYKTEAGRVPFAEWLHELDGRTAGRIEAYVDRMKAGNFGNSRSIGGGVLELKIDYGPGYRIYYLRDGLTVVVLLSGGDKSSQQTDIQLAHAYAEDYRRLQ